MSKILVLGGSYLQSDFIKSAIKEGVRVFVIDCDKYCYCARHDLGDFYEIDFAFVERVKSFCLEKKVDAVVSPVNEFGNVIAANVAKQLGFFYNPIEVVKRSTDKKLIWEKLESSNFHKVQSFCANNLQGIEYPVIVKPTVSTSSKGVSFVEKSSELDEAIAYARASGKTEDIRIEEFIDGQQFSLETITVNGQHHLMAIIEEKLSKSPYFFERTDILDHNLHEINHQYFEGFVKEILTKLEVECGPCHIEVRVKQNKIYLIDFATRSGGWRDIMLKFAGVNFNALILKSYLNLEILSTDFSKPTKTVAAGILLYYEDFQKLSKATESGLICEAYLNGKLPLLEPKTLADAYGYYFLQANNKLELQGLLPIF
jgi:carbamoylphosphate synthase large subunit